ncbi:MAG: sigma 54-interacting transcriptional regulator [Bdellovibrionales bacterium]
MSTKVIEAKKKPAERYFIEFEEQIVELGEFFSVGRHPSNHLVFFEDSFASQKHCRIEKKGNKYILKDLKSKNGTFLNGEQVIEAPLKAYDEIQVGNSVFKYRESLDLDSKIPKEFYNSKNKKWKADLEKLPAYGASEMPVLILGPSGSGKEFAARSLHFNSSRAYGELVSLNCSAFNEQLIESELFGHLEGAFTGATKNRKGAFQQAKGGTLLLDEIGDLPLSLQPKLLRALENKEIRPVGSDKAIKTDVRIIASTHKNLFKKVQEGSFREDLFYRLHALTLNPPGLSDRMEDFEDLLFFFAREYRVRFSPDAISRLKEHTWPGNIRELKNLVLRASVIHSQKGVQEDDVEGLLGELSQSGVRIPKSKSVVKEFEKQMILDALSANGGNQRKTAKELGMAKSTLHDKIKKYLQTV